MQMHSSSRACRWTSTNGTGISTIRVAALKANAPLDISWKTRLTIGGGARMPPVQWGEPGSVELSAALLPAVTYCYA
jgi:hypothetical protein